MDTNQPPTQNQFSAFFRPSASLPKAVTNSLPPNVPRNPKSFETWAELVSNVMSSRSELFNRMTDPRRNIDDECGYPKIGTVSAWDYYEMFRKESIAARVVCCVSEETWGVVPEVYESEDAGSPTPFEQAFDELGDALRGEQSYYKDEENTSHPLWEYLSRLDKLCGIGAYGVMLIGLDDGMALDQPVKGWVEENSYPVDYVRESQVPGAGLAPGASEVRDYQEKQAEERLGTILPLNQATANGKAPPPEVYPKYKLVVNEKKTRNRKIVYLRIFPEHLAQITQFESNPSSPRFGQPTMYLLTFNDPRENNVGAIGLTTATVNVHWTRVIHVADNLTSSEVFGTPRQEPVLRRLLDLEKLYAGSAEMYWRCASPGLSFETHPSLGGDVDVDKASLRDEFENYSNGLQKALFLMGMSAKTLSPSIVDPGTYIERQIEAICIRLGIPIRIFKGSERGEMSSGQDDGTWNDRIRGRQRNFVSPRIVIPTLDRFIMLGVLPKPSYKPEIAPPLDPQNPLAPKPLGADGKPLDSSALDPDKEILPDEEAPPDTFAPAAPGKANAVSAKGVPNGATPSRFPKPAPGGKKPPFPTRNAFPPPKKLLGPLSVVLGASSGEDEDTLPPGKAPAATEKNGEAPPGDPKALFAKGSPLAKKDGLKNGSIPPSAQNPYGLESEPPLVKAKLGYCVYWPDVQISSDAQKAQVASTKTAAMSAYIAGGVNALIPEAEYLVRFMGFTEEEANVMIEQSQAAKEEQELIDMEKQIQAVEEGLAPDMSDPKSLEAMAPKGGPPGFGGPPGAGGGPPKPGGPKPPPFGGPKPKFGGPKDKPPFVKNRFTENANPDGCNQYTGKNCGGIDKEVREAVLGSRSTTEGMQKEHEELFGQLRKRIYEDDIGYYRESRNTFDDIALRSEAARHWSMVGSRNDLNNLDETGDEFYKKQLALSHRKAKEAHAEVAEKLWMFGYEEAVKLGKLHKEAAALHHDAAEMLVGNAFDESKHPRDDDGRFASGEVKKIGRHASLSQDRSEASQGAIDATREALGYHLDLPHDLMSRLIREEQIDLNDLYERIGQTFRDGPLNPKEPEEWHREISKRSNALVNDLERYKDRVQRDIHPDDRKQYYRTVRRFKEVAALHHDAAEEYVGNAEGENCGTGAGGFKEGNTCGKVRDISPPSPLGTRKGDVTDYPKKDPLYVEEYEASKAARSSSEEATKETQKLVNRLSKLPVPQFFVRYIAEELQKIERSAKQAEDTGYGIYRSTAVGRPVRYGFDSLARRVNSHDHDTAYDAHDRIVNMLDMYLSKYKNRKLIERLKSLHEEAKALHHDASRMVIGNAEGTEAPEGVESNLSPDEALTQVKAFLGVR